MSNHTSQDPPEISRRCFNVIWTSVSWVCIRFEIHPFSISYTRLTTSPAETSTSILFRQCSQCSPTTVPQLAVFSLAPSWTPNDGLSVSARGVEMTPHLSGRHTHSVYGPPMPTFKWSLQLRRRRQRGEEEETI